MLPEKIGLGVLSTGKSKQSLDRYRSRSPKVPVVSYSHKRVWFTELWFARCIFVETTTKEEEKTQFLGRLQVWASRKSEKLQRVWSLT
ncbi:hypothetical protein AAC387_Pa01g2603 [Persea americana]